MSSNISNIDIQKVKPYDLYKYTFSQLVYIYLSVFEIAKNYSIENLEHQNILFADFKVYIKHTKQVCTLNKFISECRWYWCLIPNGTEIMPKAKTVLPKFSFYSKPITNILPRTNINLLQVYEVIKQPKYYQKQTTDLRQITDLNKQREFKKTNFDYVTFSGTFEKRNSKNVLLQSGYLCIDIDHVKNDLNQLKTKLINDANLEIQLLFISPSGDGLKLVVYFDTMQNTLLEIFNLVEIYFKQVYNIQIDKACKNIDRACFLCYDNDVFINPKILNHES